MKWMSERDLAQKAGVRLFCLPHAGSGAAGFYRWKRLLPEWIAVCPVLLPGRESRIAETPMRNVTEIVRALHEAAKGLLDEPFAIFGHSMGALLAYEWVVLIEREGLRPPECLFVSGRNAPQMGPGHRGLHEMKDEVLVAELAARYGGSPAALLEDAEMRSVFLPILRADLAVVESYVWSERDGLRCPVRAFAGVDDRSVSDEGLEKWREVTEGSFACRRFVGDHFFNLGVEQGELLAAIAAQLAKS